MLNYIFGRFDFMVINHSNNNLALVQVRLIANTEPNNAISKTLAKSLAKCLSKHQLFTKIMIILLTFMFTLFQSSHVLAFDSGIANTSTTSHHREDSPNYTNEAQHALASINPEVVNPHFDINAILQSVINPTLAINLTSTLHSVNTGNLGHDVNIAVGSHNLEVSRNQFLTPSEAIAVSQILGTNHQSLILNLSGQAIGGSLNAYSLGNNISNLQLPSSVTLVDNSSKLIITGNLANYGDIVFNGSGNLQAKMILNENGGLISSSGTLNLTTTALINEGGIYGSSGVNINAPMVYNAGIIEAALGNINITNANTLDITGTQASIFEAGNGKINIDVNATSLTQGINLAYANYLSKELNLNAESGYIQGVTNNVTGQINVIANSAHLVTVSKDMLIGNALVNGDPTYVNTGGDISLNGSVTSSSASLAIIASGNINVASSSTASITTSGGSLIMIAGLGSNITSTNTNSSTIPTGATQTTTNITVTLGASSGNTGGNIDLVTNNGLTGATVIDTSNTTGNGGNITLVAIGSGSSGGEVLTSNTTNTYNLNAVSTNTGSIGGNVLIIAGASPATATNTINIGNITTSGGTVSLYTQAAQASAVTISPAGVVTGGSINNNGTNIANAGITVVAINTTGANGNAGASGQPGSIGESAGKITIQAGGNISINSIDANGGNGGAGSNNFNGGNGGAGGAVNVVSTSGSVNLNFGLSASGGNGGTGGNASGSHTTGGVGGNGGNVNISTSSGTMNLAYGLVASGGNGGNGGTGSGGSSSAGGAGGNSGSITITNATGSINTLTAALYATGGIGGSGNGGYGGDGGNGGSGGSINITTTSGSIDLTTNLNAYGGTGGFGGSGGDLGGNGGNGGNININTTLNSIDLISSLNVSGGGGGGGGAGGGFQNGGTGGGGGNGGSVLITTTSNPITITGNIYALGGGAGGGGGGGGYGSGGGAGGIGGGGGGYPGGGIGGSVTIASSSQGNITLNGTILCNFGGGGGDGGNGGAGGSGSSSGGFGGDGGFGGGAGGGGGGGEPGASGSTGGSGGNGSINSYGSGGVGGSSSTGGTSGQNGLNGFDAGFNSSSNGGNNSGLPYTQDGNITITANNGTIITNGQLSAGTITLTSTGTGGITINSNVGTSIGSDIFNSTGSGYITTGTGGVIIGNSLNLSSNSGEIGFNGNGLITQASNIVFNAPLLSVGINNTSANLNVGTSISGANVYIETTGNLTGTGTITAPVVGLYSFGGSLGIGSAANLMQINAHNIGLQSYGTGSSVYVNDTYTGNTVLQASQASLSAGSTGFGGVFKLDTAGPLTIYAQIDQGGVVTPGVISAQIIAIQTFSGYGIYNDASIQSNDFIFLTASQNGYIAEPTTGALMMAPNIALVSGGGAIGAGGRLLLNSGIVAASTQGLNNFVNIYDEASQSGINGGQSGSSFTFNTNGNLNVYGSVATGAGSNANGGEINLSANGIINIGTSTGVSLTTNNGPIVVQNNNTTAGSINFAKNSFVYTNTPVNTAGYVVFNIGAYTQANTRNPNPTSISVQASGGASVFFGNNGITATASGNTLNAKGQSIVFNTGSLGANAITLNGNVSITADPPVVSSGFATIQNSLPLTNSFSQSVNTTNTLVNNPIPANVLDNNQAGLLLNNYATNQVSQSNATIYNNNDTDNNDIVNNTSLIMPIACHHIESGISVNGLKQESGLPLATNNHKTSLTQGSAIIVASQDIVVALSKTKSATLLLKRGAIVLAIVNSGIVSVYNLHDNHKDSVIVKSDDRKIKLNPGQHLTVLASNYLTDFANVNQAKSIGYRDLKTNTSNGTVTYMSDFSILSAINAIKPLKAMFKRKDCQNLANQLLKTSCIVTQSSSGKGIYEQVVKPKLTAMK